MPSRSWTVLLAVVAVLCYAHTLGHGFVHDDVPDLVRNVHVKSLGNLPTIFSSTAREGSGIQSALYRPLTTASFALNYWISGDSPWSYHLTNLALYVLTCIAVYRLMIVWPLSVHSCRVASLLFAVHPVHVEVVANVAGRKEALMTLCGLLALLAHEKARTGRRAWLPVMAAGYLASMLSKETGIVFWGLAASRDLLLPTGEQWTGRDPRKATTWTHGVWALTVVSFALIRFSVVQQLGPTSIPHADNPLGDATTGVRLMTAVAVVGVGFSLLACPVRLSPDYSYNAIPLVQHLWDDRFALTLIVIVAALVAAVALRRRARILLFGTVWYFLTLAPAANMVMPIGTIFGERLLFLPSVAACAVAGYLLAEALGCRDKAIVWSVAAALAGLLGVRTYTYAATWKDPLSLFTAAVLVVQDSAKAQFNLGTHLARSGRFLEAEPAFRRALEVSPDFSEAHNQLGNICTLTGRADLALEHYVLAVRCGPDNVEATFNLAKALDRRKSRSRAIEQYRRFLRQAPAAYDPQKRWVEERIRILSRELR
ncbi:MAG: tetratricopeptide repeat protein [Planctomycetota bacterium]